ncbi:SDR family oxidoreductase [Lysobacter sp. CA199]|uniref:SDR family oxidoreductase n=1 Tax=Lysobacter sp. CA199 TaxID=3455608 RepID=UPI003F8D6A66
MSEIVLVTGGTGFVAGWCIVELLRRGYEVRTTVRNLAKEPALREAIGSAIEAGDRLTCFAADLTRDEGWDAAMAGCDYVLHVASPLGFDAGAGEGELSIPARDGTLRVLRAAVDAAVKRVVMTSAAAVATPPLRDGDTLSDETVWFDPAEAVDGYRQSKRLAERAAWDFMHHCSGPMTLATILPGAVFGPVLSRDNLGSAQIIDRLMQGKMPATPRLGFEVVDVRDLADIHIRAMSSPRAANQRFLAVGEFLWMSEIAQVLRSRLGPAANKVPRRTLPDFVFRLMARLDPSLRAMTPRLGRKILHTSAKAKESLGWQSRSTASTLVDCANSLRARMPA